MHNAIEVLQLYESQATAGFHVLSEGIKKQKEMQNEITDILDGIAHIQQEELPSLSLCEHAYNILGETAKSVYSLLDLKFIASTQRFRQKRSEVEEKHVLSEQLQLDLLCRGLWKALIVYHQIIICF